jgi:DNA invertase Pin-like site-specific DNA recombinase
LALAACRAGDRFVVTKLDRLAQSLPDARDILESATYRRRGSVACHVAGMVSASRSTFCNMGATRSRRRGR